MSQTSRMPSELRVLVGLLGFAVALGVVGLVAGGEGWINLIVNAVMLVALLRGSEGARELLLLGAVIGVVTHGIGVVAAVGLLDPAVGVVSLIGMGSAVFTFWCLRLPSVQRWMLARTLGVDVDELAAE